MRVFSFQIDIWMGVTEVGIPVDFRVPIQLLPSVEAHLQSQNIGYSTMIDDLQVQTHKQSISQAYFPLPSSAHHTHFGPKSDGEGLSAGAAG